MELEKELRHYIYQSFLNTSFAPSFEQMLVHFEKSEDDIKEGLHNLADKRLIVLEPGTQRVLMAHPFSNFGSSYIVTDIPARREYFANCGWDAVAFHFMLKKAIRIDGYCRGSLEKFFVEILDTNNITTSHPEFVVMISRPPSTWWDNIHDTCANHMNIFGSAEIAKDWAEKQKIEGEVLSWDQIFGLSRFLYENKLDKEYTRPTKEATSKAFKDLGLTSKFWRL